MAGDAGPAIDGQVQLAKGPDFIGRTRCLRRRPDDGNEHVVQCVRADLDGQLHGRSADQSAGRPVGVLGRRKQAPRWLA